MKIAELQCIMPIADIPMLLNYGILSYERASKLPHRSVAMDDVQEKRDQVCVPGAGVEVVRARFMHTVPQIMDSLGA